MLSFFDNLQDNKPHCPRCKLGVRCLRPVFPVYGTGSNGIMLVVDNPSYEDELYNTPLNSNEGHFLKRVLSDIGLDWEECWITHAVNCNANEVSHKHIQYCRPYVIDSIRTYRPKVVVTLGKDAMKSVLGYFETDFKDDMSLWDGIPVACREFDCWILPLHSTRYVMDCEKIGMVLTKFKEHLQNAFDHTTKSVRERVASVAYSESAILYPDNEQVVKLLEQFGHKDAVAFDYETTGLKPDLPEQQIVSMALSDGETTFAFMMDKSLHVPVKRFLKSEAGKIAANYKFEENWSVVKLRCPVNNWIHDTMLFALCELNRPGTTGLKFQAFCKFGVVNYNKEVDDLLKGDGSNGLNQIYRIPKRTLLKYNALDALYEWHLYYNQRREWE